MRQFMVSLAILLMSLQYSYSQKADSQKEYLLRQRIINGDVKGIDELVKQGMNLIEPIGSDKIIPLFLAIELKQISVIDYCIKNKLPLMSTDWSGTNTLDYACKYGNLNIFKRLEKEIDFDINANDSRGYPLIYYAVAGNNLDILKYLFGNGAVINEYSKHALFEACLNGSFDIVKFLIEEKNIDINSKYSDGSNVKDPLLNAMESGNISLVKYLLSKGCKIDKQLIANNLRELLRSDHYQMIEYCFDTLNIYPLLDIRYKPFIFYNAITNPLNEDATKKSIEFIEYLIKKHNFDINGSLDYFGKTPIMVAVSSGNIQVIKYFIENECNIKEKDNNGLTAYDYSKSEEIRKYLMDLGLKTGKSFHNACASGDTTYLLQAIKEGVDINLANRDGKRGINLATLNRHPDLVKILLENHAQINFKENNGHSPLFDAIKNNDLDLVQLFIKYGVDLNQNIQRTFNDVLKNKNIGMLNFLIDNGASFYRFHSYKNVLMEAAENGFNEGIEILLNHDFSIHARDYGGKTALMYAAEKGNFSTVKLLLKKGADIKEKSYRGETILMLATKSNNFDLVNYLLILKCDTKAVDMDNKKAIDYTISQQTNH